MKKWLPVSFVLAALVMTLAGAFPKKDKTYAWNEFGRIPILAGGRVQPIESLARNSLMKIHRKGSAMTSLVKKGPDKGRKMPAAEWIAEMMFAPDRADTRPVFRIDHPQLKGVLDIPAEANEEKLSDGKNYSWKQLAPKFEELQKEAMSASSKKAEQRDTFEKAVVELWSSTQIYLRLQNMVQPRLETLIAIMKRAPESPGSKEVLNMAIETKAASAVEWGKELTAFLNNAPTGLKAFSDLRAGKPHDEAALMNFRRDLVRFELMSMRDQAHVIPPAKLDKDRQGWVTTGDALMEYAGGGDKHFAIDPWGRMADGFRQENSSVFNDSVRGYFNVLQGKYDIELAKSAQEQAYNRLNPFGASIPILLIGFLLVLAYWGVFMKHDWMRSAALGLTALAFVLLTVGLIYRMSLEGRPPVTNLYSSALFIGWGCVLFCMVVEWFWKNSIALAVATMLGFATQVIAVNLIFESTSTGDTMEMMRAVLDTNFWLATHVVIVTLGYSATFMAGVFAWYYIILGMFTPLIAKQTSKTFASVIYGIVCFATLFSFFGTVLGGIWADQSWGRFWGWDAKENGALMIVIWNALILHSKWGGLVRDRGIAMLAVLGNIITAWSWFGVNMLGIGLHSYGFMDSAFWWLAGFAAFNIVIVLMAAVPQKYWVSFRTADNDLPGKPPTTGSAIPAT